MKRYIARIKLDNKPLCGLICSGERDYIFSFPKSSHILNEGGYFNFHFTLHTANNRLTHKITDFGNSTKSFEDILDEAEKNGNFYVSKNKDGSLRDIDMTKGEIHLDLDNPGFIGGIFKFGIKNIHNKKKKIIDFFGDSKKSDEKFEEVINIEYPEKLLDIEIQMKVCKNVMFNPLDAFRSKNIKFEKGYLLQDKLGNDVYTFILLVKDGVGE
jgi:hypothetical protein